MKNQLQTWLLWVGAFKKYVILCREVKVPGYLTDVHTSMTRILNNKPVGYITYTADNGNLLVSIF